MMIAQKDSSNGHGEGCSEKSWHLEPRWYVRSGSRVHFVCGWRARSARAVPKPQTMLVNDSYLVSLFCRRGKPSHSHCKGPVQISHCESQSGASPAGSHWLQTQKVMVMFRHTQLKHTLMHPPLLACKNWIKGLLTDIALKYFPEWDKWIIYSKCPDLIRGPAFCLGSLTTNSAMNLGEGGSRRINSKKEGTP